MCKNACAGRWARSKPERSGKGSWRSRLVRFAAGAGVVAASLLIVGPNPAQAVADKNGSGSHSRDDDRKSGSNGQGNRAKRRVPNLVNDVVDDRTRGIDKDSLPNLEPPGMDLGTAGSDLADLAIAQSIAAEGPIAAIGGG